MTKFTRLLWDEKTVKNVLSEYKIHNADILIHDDSSVDDLIDVIEGIHVLYRRQPKVRGLSVLLQ